MRSKPIDRINKVLFFFILLFASLYFASTILIPLLFGALFAMLMHTAANYFESKGMSRGASSTICTLIVLITVAGIAAIMINQLLRFSEDLPQMQERLTEYYEKARAFIYQEFGITRAEQEKFIEKRGNDLSDNAGQIIQTALGGIMSMLIGFLLALVYMFLMLYNRDKYVKTLEQLVNKENRGKAAAIGKKVSKVAQKYLWGRIQVMTLLGIMYLITFLAFGLQYAVLLTVFGALVTIIPYIGPFVSGIFPVLIAILTGMEFGTILILAILVLIIQLIESYVLEPVLMGSEVDLSPLAIILSILIGGSIWGISGMILFVPMLAMAKIYFDHMENLKPYGMLIGTSSPKTHQMIKNLLDKVRKKNNGR
jgi:predicted PurR-regulated permease PerM